ncbi:MAG: hypothetical protein BRD34_02935 [Bacteroidetes bacterium QH_6_64_77]|nr:MAG: hypothetical protein BRD34_02935 [Bacteroidetes bacterium QH_6_64_77]
MLFVGRRDGAPVLIPSAPNQRQFSAPFNGSQQGLLMDKVAFNGNGAVAVVNSTFKRGDKSAIWLHRGQRPGQ